MKIIKYSLLFCILTSILPFSAFGQYSYYMTYSPEDSYSTYPASSYYYYYTPSYTTPNYGTYYYPYDTSQVVIYPSAPRPAYWYYKKSAL